MEWVHVAVLLVVSWNMANLIWCSISDSWFLGPINWFVVCDYVMSIWAQLSGLNMSSFHMGWGVFSVFIDSWLSVSYSWLSIFNSSMTVMAWFVFNDVMDWSLNVVYNWWWFWVYTSFFDDQFFFLFLLFATSAESLATIEDTIN